jgi:hypothetical protein
MATDNNSKLKQNLDKRLVILQSESAAVQTLIAQTNQKEYENLSEIYLWWRAASTIEGYLEEALKPTMSRGVHKHANDGTTFRRLLYLMYGNYGIGKDDLDRKNQVLLGLHEEYERNQKLYAKDGVNKLAGYIKSQGGANGIIKRSANPPTAQVTANASTANNSHPTAAPLSSNSETASAPNTQSQSRYQTYQPRIDVKISDSMRHKALLEEATKYFAKQPTFQQVSITSPIATNKEGYGLALVRRNNAVYDLIGATDGIQGIRELLVSAYRKQFSALPPSMRCFFEIIKTQSLPSNIQKLYDRLIETSFEKHEDDNTRKKIHRRVMYVANENMLVLSPTYSKSGVVTMAKLKGNPFEGKANDCFMPTRCRKLIEQRMIASNDFNLFAPSNPDSVPRFKTDGLASHMLRLDNKADAGDFVFVEFWNFEEEQGAANEQLFFVPSLSNKSTAKIVLPKSDLQTLAFDHIDKWLDSYGEHITRRANQLFEFGFDQNGFNLGFDFVNDVFRNHAVSPFEQPLLKPVTYKATFLTKDICLLLHSLGSLQLTSDIEIEGFDDVMVINFSTEVADYTIAIPTTKGMTRKSDAFCVYSAEITKSTPVTNDGSSIEDELLFEAALAKSNADLTESEIDRLFGSESDDYEEILEGWLPQAYEGADNVEWTNISEQ